MILDCGKCALPSKDEAGNPAGTTASTNTPDTNIQKGSEVAEQTESPQPAEDEASTPAATGEPEAGEGNKKKKSKAKKKPVEAAPVEEKRATLRPEASSKPS